MSIKFCRKAMIENNKYQVALIKNYNLIQRVSENILKYHFKSEGQTEANINISCWKTMPALKHNKHFNHGKHADRKYLSDTRRQQYATECCSSLAPGDSDEAQRRATNAPEINFPPPFPKTVTHTNTHRHSQ